VDQKMLLATAGKNPPDVAGLWTFNLNVFADNGSIIPLDDYCRKHGIGRDHYIPCYWDMVQHRGHTWALLSTPASIGLYWNKQLFREAGLDPDRPPRTMTELWDFSKKLTVKNPDGSFKRLGFMQSEPGWWHWAWGCFFGGKLWDGKGRITAACPENVRAFEWIQSYSREFGTKSLTDFSSGFGNFSSPQNAFMGGKVAMELQGVWMGTFIAYYNPKLEYGAAPFPYPDDRPDLANTTIAEADILVIPRYAKHPDEAFEFIKFVNSQRGMEILCTGQGKHTPLAQVSDQFLRGHKNPYVKLFIDLANGTNVAVTPPIGIWTEYRDEMRDAFERVWLQQKDGDPLRALQYVEARMQPKFDRLVRRQRMRQQRGLMPVAGMICSSLDLRQELP
jgi:ABC-type glycerol-3-phosphate transport system substrate-binding protein